MQISLFETITLQLREINYIISELIRINYINTELKEMLF